MFGSLLTKEYSFPFPLLNELSVWIPKDLHDTGQLFLFILAREDGKSSVHFRQDAAEAPHVDSHVVLDAQNDLGRSIESTLDIRIDCQRRVRCD